MTNQQQTECRPLLMTARDAAKFLSISERTLFALKARGEIRATKIGSRGIRYRVADLEDFAARAAGVEA